MEHWLYHTQWLGNSTLAWVVAAAGALTGYVVAHAAAALIGRRLRKLAERTGRSGFALAADVAAATHGWLLLLIAIVVALNFLHLKAPAPHWLKLATFALLGAQIAFWITALIVGWLERSAQRAGDRPVNAVMLGILTWAIQFVVWVTLLLAVLHSGGVEITAFVASLGVGGIAVALAAQNILGDLFASISIGLDKPFEVGEFIAFGSDLGTVTKVGVKSTRIRSLSGEELAIGNAELLKGLIRNYSRMRERRVVFQFRLPFETPRDRIPTVVERVRQFIEDEGQTRFDRGHLAGFGDWGLDLEFVYYVLDPGFGVYRDIQQRINLRMLDAFDELGIEFAVPARRLHAAPQDGLPGTQPPPEDP